MKALIFQGNKAIQIESLISELKKVKEKNIYCDGGRRISKLLMDKVESEGREIISPSPIGINMDRGGFAIHLSPADS